MEGVFGGLFGKVLSLLGLRVWLRVVEQINTVFHQLVSQLGVLGKGLDGLLHRSGKNSRIRKGKKEKKEKKREKKRKERRKEEGEAHSS